MEHRTQVINEEQSRVFDIIIPEDGGMAEIQVKTGKGSQSYRKIGLDKALQQILEALMIQNTNDEKLTTEL
jgi:hypothetical protein